MFDSWITEPGLRCFLVEARYLEAGETKTLRRANMPYRSKSSDSPALTPYPDTIIAMGDFTRDMSEAFVGFSISGAGAIELFLDDEIKELLTTANFAGQAVTIKAGAPDWSLSQFGTLVEHAICGGLQQVDDSTAKLTFRDRASVFDKPLLTETYSSGPSKGEFKPIALGQCFNISPVLIDANAKKYQVNNGPLEAITQVRENGLSIPYTANLTDGTFTTTNAVKGRITADVKGHKHSGTWLQSGTQTINYLLSTLGLAVTTDTAVLPDYLMGLYITQDTPVKQLLDDVVSSVGGAWFYNRKNKFRLIRYTGVGTVAHTLSQDDYEDGTLKVARRIEPLKSIKLGYQRNFTPQADGLAGSVRELTPTIATRYEKEYSYIYVENANITTQFPEAEAITVPSALVSESDCQAEANRRKDLAAGVRHVWELTAFTTPFKFNLGETINVQTAKTQFLTGVITRLVDDYDEETVKLELVI